VLKGIGLVFGQPNLRKFVWRPLMVGAGIYLLFFCGGFYLVLSGLAHYVQPFGVGGNVAGALGGILFLLVWWLVSASVYLTVTSLASSWVWGALSAAVEAHMGVEPETRRVNLLTDAVPRVAFAALITVLILLLGWIGLFPAVLLAGWLSLYDYTSSAYLRRGVSFPGQFKLVFECRSWPSFSLTCGALTLIPLVNVILLPGLVAGGTLMVLESERERMQTLPNA
jgi:uncharacterized protein involved in cysteine biosynthesis